jgi:hypothetical protein
MTTEEAPVNTLNELIANPQKVKEAGGLSRALLQLVPVKREERQEFWSSLADAHNAGKVDLVAEFALLRNGKEGPDFFSTRQIFVETFPKLKTNCVNVGRTVAHLVIEAGGDMAASWPLEAFRTYLDHDTKRPVEILTAIEADPSSLAILLPVTAAAGFGSDRPYFIDEVVRLTKVPDELLQRMAIAALANLPVPADETDIPPEVLSSLENAVASSDHDGVLAASASAALTLSSKNKLALPRLTEVVRLALKKGGDWTLGVAADSYATNVEKLDISVVELLSENLKSRANEGALSRIDLGVSSLLNSSNRSLGLEVLEELLKRFSQSVVLKNFQSAKSVITSSSGLQSYVVTRWLASGDPILCEAAADAVQNVAGADISIDADATQLDFQDEVSIVFIARKAAGYLFFSPVAAASFLISLMRGGVVEPIKQLLLDPLLLNYTGSVRELLQRRIGSETGEVLEALRECLERIDAYLTAVGTASGIKELRMSEGQQAIYNRSLSQKISKSFEEARAELPLLSLLKRSVVLYGRGSVQHVARQDGSIHRADMMFKTHGTEFTFPRMMHIDELGLHFLVRVLRAQKRVK